MANDLSELQTYIKGDLQRNDTSLSDIILLDIVSSIRNYEGFRFFFNERVLGPVTLSATDIYAFSLWAPGSTVSTPSDVIEVDSFRVNLTNRAYTLTEKTYAELDEIDEQSSSTTGYPEYWAPFNRGVRIYPQPSASLAMTGTLSAHVKFPDLATGTDSNVWTNEAKELIRCSTLKLLWGRRFRDYEAAQAVAIAEQGALALLQRRTSGLAGNTIRSYR